MLTMTLRGNTASYIFSWQCGTLHFLFCFQRYSITFQPYLQNGQKIYGPSVFTYAGCPAFQEGENSFKCKNDFYASPIEGESDLVLITDGCNEDGTEYILKPVRFTVYKTRKWTCH